VAHGLLALASAASDSAVTPAFNRDSRFGSRKHEQSWPLANHWASSLHTLVQPAISDSVFDRRSAQRGRESRDSQAAANPAPRSPAARPRRRSCPTSCVRPHHTRLTQPFLATRTRKAQYIRAQKSPEGITTRNQEYSCLETNVEMRSDRSDFNRMMLGSLRVATARGT